MDRLDEVVIPAPFGIRLIVWTDLGEFYVARKVYRLSGAAAAWIDDYAMPIRGKVVHWARAVAEDEIV